MQNLSDIKKLNFYNDLIKDPKPTFLPYFKSEGPIITDANQSEVVEALMIDYLRKKLEILQYFKDYDAKKSDIEILQQFEYEVLNNIGKRMPVMYFYMFDPAQDVDMQFEKIMSEENFHSWAVK
jgi:hypothetical protein